MVERSSWRPWAELLSWRPWAEDVPRRVEEGGKWEELQSQRATEGPVGGRDRNR